MTGRVRAAMLREETSYSVQLTCPNNHTATYLPPPRE
jgi:hypothetical protein